MKISSDIWEALAKHDKNAYSKVFVHFYNHLFNYGKKFTSDTGLVEDAVQETLLTVWDKRTSLNEIRSPETYFYNTFRYLLFDRIKRNNKLASFDNEQAGFEFSIDEKLIQKEQGSLQIHKLKGAISSLTPRQREAIFLRFYEGLSYEEVAEILAITQKATYKIVARALLQLKDHFLLLLIIIVSICLFSSI